MAGKGSSQRLSYLDILLLNHSDSDEEHFDVTDEEEVDFAIGLEKLSLGPKKKLLVINISGFLLSKIFCGKPKVIPNDPNDGSTRIGNFLLYKRPFCEEFLKFCFERFEVGVWSSALRHNVKGALSYVMGSLERKLLFVWDQTYCKDSGFKSRTDKRNRKHKPLFLKELKKIWNEVKMQGPYTAKNTLLIEDEPEKALLNPPYTGIFPIAYDAAENKVDNFLDPKGEFVKFLEGLAEADDVQYFVKKNPIGQPAISSNHPDWDFYDVVLRSLS